MNSTTPQVFLGTAAFAGESFAERRLRAAHTDRFRTPTEIAAVFYQAALAHVDGVITLSHLNVLKALRKVRRTLPGLQVYPIIPNVIGYVREATDYGLVGAARRRLQQLALVDLFRIGLRGVRNTPGVLKRDFNTLMAILFEVEMASFRALRPRVVFLHGQITDLALALGNRALFELYVQVMRKRFGAEPGLATNNLGWLLPQLEEWQLEIPFLLTPVNPSGFLMKPSKSVCEALLRATPSVVIADKVDTVVEPDGNTWGYLRRHGIRAALIEFRDDKSLASVVKQAKEFLAGEG